MKTVKLIGDQVRNALNQQRGYVSAVELSDAIWQASNQVFGHYAGHQALLRPGQPVTATGYGLNDPVNAALNPFLKAQEYTANPGLNQLPWAADGTILYPVIVDANQVPTLENSFQRPVALTYPGARRVTEKNENQLHASQANSLTAPTVRLATRTPVPGGQKVLPGPGTQGGPAVVTLGFLCAPPRPVYAEIPDQQNELDLVYDDATSVDVGWKDVTAINLIITYATRLLGGQVKDQQAVGIATQTTQLGA